MDQRVPKLLRASQLPRWEYCPQRQTMEKVEDYLFWDSLNSTPKRNPNCTSQDPPTCHRKAILEAQLYYIGLEQQEGASISRQSRPKGIGWKASVRWDWLWEGGTRQSRAPEYICLQLGVATHSTRWRGGRERWVKEPGWPRLSPSEALERKEECWQLGWTSGWIAELGFPLALPGIALGWGCVGLGMDFSRKPSHHFICRVMAMF